MTTQPSSKSRITWEIRSSASVLRQKHEIQTAEDVGAVRDDAAASFLLHAEQLATQIRQFAVLKRFQHACGEIFATVACLGLAEANRQRRLLLPCPDLNRAGRLGIVAARSLVSGKCQRTA